MSEKTPCALCGLYPWTAFGRRGRQQDDTTVQDLRDALALVTERNMALMHELYEARQALRAMERKDKAQLDAAVDAVADAQREAMVKRTWLARKVERQRKALTGLEARNAELKQKLQKIHIDGLKRGRVED